MIDPRWDEFGDRASARRAAARSLHPDVGGDAARFAAALDAIDRHFGTGPHRPHSGPILIRRSRRGAIQAKMHALRRQFRRGGKSSLGRRRYLSI